MKIDEETLTKVQALLGQLSESGDPSAAEGWFTTSEYADRLSMDRGAALKRLKALYRAGHLECGRKSKRKFDGVVQNTHCWRLKNAEV